MNLEYYWSTYKTWIVGTILLLLIAMSFILLGLILTSDDNNSKQSQEPQVTDKVIDFNKLNLKKICADHGKVGVVITPPNNGQFYVLCKDKTKIYSASLK